MFQADEGKGAEAEMQRSELCLSEAARRYSGGRHRMLVFKNSVCGVDLSNLPPMLNQQKMGTHQR